MIVKYAMGAGSYDFPTKKWPVFGREFFGSPLYMLAYQTFKREKMRRIRVIMGVVFLRTICNGPMLVDSHGSHIGHI